MVDRSEKLKLWMEGELPLLIIMKDSRWWEGIYCFGSGTIRKIVPIVVRASLRTVSDVNTVSEI